MIQVTCDRCKEEISNKSKHLKLFFAAEGGEALLLATDPSSGHIPNLSLMDGGDWCRKCVTEYLGTVDLSYGEPF